MPAILAIALLTVLALSSASAASPLARNPPCDPTTKPADPPRSVLVEVRIGRYASTAVMAIESPCNGLLVPVARVLSLAGLSVDARNGLIRARLALGVRLEVDPRRLLVRRGRARRVVAEGDLVVASDRVFASLPVIGHLLGLEVTYDESAAAVDVRGADALPVALHALRALQRFARDSAQQHAGDGEGVARTSDANRRIRAGLAVEYDLVAAHQSVPGDRSLIDSARAASARGGSWQFSSSVGIAAPIASGVTTVRLGGLNGFALQSVAWERAWPAARRLTALRLGDLVTGGVRHDLVRGVSLTNALLAPPSVAAVVPVTGRLPAGWQMDASRADAGLDVDVAGDGRYSLGVPLQLGTTVVDFVATAPTGEQRVFQQSFHTPPLFVPARRLEYSLAAGACTRRVAAAPGSAMADRECAGATNAELRYGFNGRLAMRVGVDGTMAEGSRATVAQRPYIGIGGVVARALVAQGSYAAHQAGGPGVASGSIRFEPSPAFTIASDFSASDIIAVASVPVVGPGATDATPFALRYVRGQLHTTWLRYAPVSWSDRVAIEALVTGRSYGGVVSSMRRAAIALHWSSVRLTPFWRTDEVSNAPATSTLGADGTLLASGVLARALGASWLRVSAERRSGSSASWSSSIVHSASRWRVEVGARHLAEQQRTVWTFAFMPQMSRAQALTMVTSDPVGHSTRSVQMLRGASVYDADSFGATFSSEPTSERGGVAGVVFVDRDGNGTRDAGEPGVAGARLIIGNRVVVSDSAGRYASWGDAAYQDMALRVDTSSLASPWWVPAWGTARVRVPNGARVTVDVPLVVGGIVSGTVDYDPSLGTAVVHAPAQVVLTHLGTGVRHVVNTFSDGTFYESGLRPGKYEVTLAALPGDDATVVKPVIITLRGDGAAGTVVSVRLVVQSRW